MEPYGEIHYACRWLACGGEVARAKLRTDARLCFRTCLARRTGLQSITTLKEKPGSSAFQVKRCSCELGQEVWREVGSKKLRVAIHGSGSSTETPADLRSYFSVYNAFSVACLGCGLPGRRVVNPKEGKFQEETASIPLRGTLEHGRRAFSRCWFEKGKAKFPAAALAAATSSKESKRS